MKRVKPTFILAGLLACLVTPAALAAPGTGTLYGTSASGGNLISINTQTGVGTIIGPIGAFVVPALAVHPLTGVLYAGQGAGNANIYTVNPATGVGTLLGPTGLAFAAVGDLAFSPSGVLYASVNIVGDGGSGSDNLATINLSTGAATVIGPYGGALDGMEAISFDSGGQLWGARDGHAGTGTPGLYTINTTTGAATLVAPIVGVSIVSLQWACDGTLFGGSGRSSGAATDGGRLVRINPANGSFTFVGGVAATGAGGLSLGGLAFANACASGIPTLSPWSLAALGALILLAGVAVLRIRSAA